MYNGDPAAGYLHDPNEYEYQRPHNPQQPQTWNHGHDAGHPQAHPPHMGYPSSTSNAYGPSVGGHEDPNSRYPYHSEHFGGGTQPTNMGYAVTNPEGSAREKEYRTFDDFSQDPIYRSTPPAPHLQFPIDRSSLQPDHGGDAPLYQHDAFPAGHLGRQQTAPPQMENPHTSPHHTFYQAPIVNSNIEADLYGPGAMNRHQTHHFGSEAGPPPMHYRGSETTTNPRPGISQDGFVNFSRSYTSDGVGLSYTIPPSTPHQFSSTFSQDFQEGGYRDFENPNTHQPPQPIGDTEQGRANPYQSPWGQEPERWSASAPPQMYHTRPVVNHTNSPHVQAPQVIDNLTNRFQQLGGFSDKNPQFSTRTERLQYADSYHTPHQEQSSGVNWYEAVPEYGIPHTMERFQTHQSPQPHESWNIPPKTTATGTINVDSIHSDATANRTPQEIAEFLWQLDSGNTPLHDAVKAGDLTQFRIHLKERGHSETNNGGYTALHFAVAYNRCRMIELLLSAGANPHVACNHRSTPLHIATYFGYYMCADMLLDALETCDAEDEEGDTPFSDAISLGQLDMIELLLDAGAASVWRTKNKNGQSPEDLMHAANYSDGMKQRIQQLVMESSWKAEEALDAKNYDNKTKAFVLDLFTMDIAHALGKLDEIQFCDELTKAEVRELLWHKYDDEYDETDSEDNASDQTDDPNPTVIPLEGYETNGTYGEPGYQAPQEASTGPLPEGVIDFFDLTGLNSRKPKPGLSPSGLQMIIQEIQDEISDIYFAATLRRVYLPYKPTNMDNHSYLSIIVGIFQWLSDVKDVRGVEDIRIQDPSTGRDIHHIIDALQTANGARFTGIKRFCWLKNNLNIHVVSQVAPDVEELWLGWDGQSDSVLNDWRNTLPSLQKLKQLHLVVTAPQLDNQEYRAIVEDAQTFCETLCQTLYIDADRVEYKSLFGSSSPELTKEPSKKFAALNGANPGSKGEVYNWFRSMKQFNNDYALSGELPNMGLRPVRVAILDTGVDMCHRQFQGKVIKRKAFPSTDIHDFLDLDGHGTHVAGLVLKVAPNAELYIARIFDDEKNCSPQSIENAIKWAVNEQVDIIGCSWGLGKKNDRIAEALTYAALKKVLVFASSWNLGNNSPKLPWPAISPTVIPIGACDKSGNSCDITHEKVKFLFPGKDIMSSFPRYLDQNYNVPHEQPESMTPPGEKAMSGCSMSTGLAVGLAARILEFARACDLENAENLKEPLEMSTVLDSMATNKFVNAWDYFTEKVNKPGAGAGPMKYLLMGLLD